MGKYFSDVVDRAIEDLYYCCDNEKTKRRLTQSCVRVQNGAIRSGCMPMPIIWHIIGDIYWDGKAVERDQARGKALLEKSKFCNDPGNKTIYKELTKILCKLELDESGRCKECAKVHDMNKIR